MTAPAEADLSLPCERGAEAPLYPDSQGRHRCRPLTTDYWLLTTALLRSFAPARQVLFLFRSQAVDLDAHRLQLEFRNPLIEVLGNNVNLLLQCGDRKRDV